MLVRSVKCKAGYGQVFTGYKILSAGLNLYYTRYIESIPGLVDCSVISNNFYHILKYYIHQILYISAVLVAL